MSDLRIGVLGAARISQNALLQPATEVPGVVVAAVAARDRGRAQAQADEWGIETVHDDYESLLADPTLDAIYNPLPTSLHHTWTLAALDAGKHVLCEKPFASNAALAREMVDAGNRAWAADGLVLMEAFHWRYHPFATRLRELLRSGVIGQIVSVAAEFSVPIDPADDVRHAYELSGGALMDLGCYPLQWVRFAVEEEPTVSSASMVEGRPMVDVQTAVELAFPGGATGSVTTRMSPGTERQIWLEVTGSLGTLRADNPLAPHRGNKITVTTVDGQSEEHVGGASTYHYQLAAFRDAIVHGAPFPTGGDDAIATMELIDACYRAAGLAPRGTV
ncbi:MAG: Gfo/Idh/MocA family oxidoreductase [Acidimicrobiales bacterium]